MYLDKPMRDHTLLQAIARVNRPYENEAQEMVKPHGFVLDFVGIFDKLEKALAFDSDEINAIVKDLKLLKVLFKNKMESKAPEYLALIDAQLQRQGRRYPHRALPRSRAAQGVLQGIQGDRDALRDHLAGRFPAAVHRATTARCRPSMTLFGRPTPGGSWWTGTSRGRPTSWCSSMSEPAISWPSRTSWKSMRIPSSYIDEQEGGRQQQGHQPDQEHRKGGGRTK